MSDDSIVEIKNKIRSFVEENIKPYEKNPRDFIKCWPLLGKENYFALLSNAYNANDKNIFTKYLILLEELCRLSISGFMLSYLSQGWIIECLQRLAVNDYHEDILNKCKKGEISGAFCMTEEGYGSSYSELKTIATLNNGKWDINGEKIYITNAAFADCYIVVANTLVNNKPVV
jgi:alkylation response protein AidB-like acyl-CoA dehydrogenase